MSQDEVAVTVVAVLLGPVMWLTRLVRWRRVPGSAGAVVALGATLAVCAAILLDVLTKMAASDVVDAPEYIFMYAVLGLAWLRVSETGFAFAGLSLRDDALERCNGAAVMAGAGALIGVTLSYAGGNIGEGPGWGVVVFAATLATAGFFAAWLVLGGVTSVQDAVTIDRDPAAGMRLAAFLIACGVVCGRAVAGDWESAAEAVRDAGAWLPWLLLILAAGVAVERVARPTSERPLAPLVALGVMPAVVYLALAYAAVAIMGWPA
jgi:hypothetical protein